MSSRIDSLIAQMTLPEKASLLAGADTWRTVPIERLNVPAIKVTDGPHGARGEDPNTGATSANFPVGMAMGATWNPDLIERVGVELAAETRAKGAQVLLAPTVNIHRTPLAGRNFECFAEDPYLSGKIAAAYIRGIQSQGIAACIKHFVANDQEFERMSISSDVDERPLHEIYLEPFRIAMEEAQPWSVMSAYNRINGTWASENEYTLNSILKGKWGFDGLVMSDWFGTYTTAVPAGGLDLEMPGPGRWQSVEAVVSAVESGSVDESVIDDKVRRLLRLMERVGAFDNPDLLSAETSNDSPAQRQLTREVAQEAIVLLKNDNDLLPLNSAEIGSIALIGQNAKWLNMMGGGSSAVNPHYGISPLEGLQAQIGDSAEIGTAIGAPIWRQPPLLDPSWLTAEDGTANALTLTYYDNPDLNGDPVLQQPFGRTGLNWFGAVDPHIDPNHFSLRLSGSVTMPVDGDYQFQVWHLGRAKLWFDDELVFEGDGSFEGTDPFQDPTTGRSEFSHAFSAERPVRIRLEFSPTPGLVWRTIRLGCMPPLPADPIQEAVDLAAKSDVAIVVAGLTDDWESEGFDRPDLLLPGDQNELIARVAAVNPNTIVVLNVGSAVEMPWIDAVSAVVHMWYAGQETGNALADILLGNVSPSGKLPTTLPVQLSDNPTEGFYPGQHGRVQYAEGIFVGYRHYDQHEVAPLFPFGYGLSYTQFDYANMVVENSAEDGTVAVRVDVTNTGDVAGKDVVQLYVSAIKPRLPRPPQELKAFAKVALQPGETKTVTLSLSRQSFAFYDPIQHDWVVENGRYELRLGRDSRDIRLTSTVDLT